MCELYGYQGSTARDCTAELREFYSHSTMHPNGWGLAFRDNGLFFVKEAKQAIQSERLAKILDRGGIISDSLIAHIRLATIGNEEWINCHPFTGEDCSGRRWVFAHNGTIFESPLLQRYVAGQKGDTDSERIFLCLLDRINHAIREKGAPLSEEERFSAADRLITEISPHNKLNLLFTDGELFYVHTNYEGSLYQKRIGTGAVFSTQPLGGEADRKNWLPVPMNLPLAYRNGEILFSGTQHSNTFHDDPEKLKALYLAFSEL